MTIANQINSRRIARVGTGTRRIEQSLISLIQLRKSYAHVQ